MELIERLKQQGVKFFTNEPMAKHTSFKIGGPADILACPSDAEQLKAAVQAAKECGVAVFIMGNGSNLLVSDEGDVYKRQAAVSVQRFVLLAR